MEDLSYLSTSSPVVPVATSTTWKVEKPDNWNDEHELTFEDQELSVSQKTENSCVTSNESALTLGKYLIPSHPSELEDDPFILELPDEIDERHINDDVDLDDIGDDLNKEAICHKDDSFSKYLTDQPESTSNTDQMEELRQYPPLLQHPVDSCEIFENPEKLHDHTSNENEDDSTKNLCSISGDEKYNSSFDNEKDEASEPSCDSTKIDISNISQNSTVASKQDLGDTFTEMGMEGDEKIKATIEEEGQGTVNQSLISDEVLYQNLAAANTKKPVEIVDEKQNEMINNEQDLCLNDSPEKSFCEGAFKSDDELLQSIVNEKQPDAESYSKDIIISPSTPNSISEKYNLNHNDVAEKILAIDQTPKIARNSYHYHSILHKINEMTVVEGISFPSVYTVDSKTIVGITKKFKIAVENNTSVWLQCLPKFDANSQDLGFTCQTKFILQPNSAEELTFSFTPSKEGLSTANLEMQVESVTGGMFPTQNLTCRITGYSEAPKLICNPFELKFGTQVTSKEATFTIENVSAHEVPIKAIIVTNGCDDVFALSDPKSMYATSFFKRVLKPNEVFSGYLMFSPHLKYSDCKGYVQVYLDSALGLLLKQIPISASVGVYKLKLPQSKHNILLETKPGTACSTKVPFMYDGNIPSSLKLSAPIPFNINPIYIPSLAPGESGEFEVMYFPTTTERVEGTLSLVLGDDNTTYSVGLEGVSSHIMPRDPSTSALLSNKTYINFGGTLPGCEVESEILLKNDTPTQLMCLQLKVVSESKCFYMSEGGKVCLNRDLVLPAGFSQSVQLGFTPFTLSQSEGELVITSKDNVISHRLPLTGHGGNAEVSIVGVQQSSSHLWVEMGSMRPNERNTVCLTLNNSGTIPAYVHGMLETTEGFAFSPNLGWVNPSSIVLGPGSSRDIFIVFEPGDEVFDQRVASLKLFYGDEISRLRYNKVVDTYGITNQKIKELSFDPTVDFLIPGNIPRVVDVKIPRLHHVEADYTEEKNLFQNGVKQLFVSILSTQKDENSMLGRVPAIPGNDSNTWSLDRDEMNLMSGAASFTVTNHSLRLLVVTSILLEDDLISVSPSRVSIQPFAKEEFKVTVKSHKSFITTLMVNTMGHGTQRLTVFHQPDFVSDKGCMTQTIAFSETPTKQSTSTSFTFSNFYEDTLTWNIRSVGPPYFKTESIDPLPKRVEYSAFCFTSVKGTTSPGGTLTIPISFYPQQPGIYLQTWEFDFTVPPTRGRDTGVREKRRIILKGRGVLPSPSPPIRPRNSSRNSSLRSARRSHDDVFLKTESLYFQAAVNNRVRQTFKLSNPLSEEVEVTLYVPRPPFHCKFPKILIQPVHSVTVPVSFHPKTSGVFVDAIGIDTKKGRLLLPLSGNTVPR